MSREEALVHFKSGRPRAAAVLLQSLLRSAPDDARSWFLLGASFHALNELSEASLAFLRCIAIDPTNAEAHLAYISVLRDAGNSSDALAACRNACTRFPTNSRITYVAALCHDDIGQSDIALALYEDALRIAPNLEDALHNRGLLLTRLGRLDEAEANQRKYVAAFPDAPRAYSVLADVMLARGEAENALDALDTALRLAPDDVVVQVRRGIALACVGRFAEAEIAFRVAITANPDRVSRYLDRIRPDKDSTRILSAHNIFFWHCHRAQGLCEWSKWEACAENLRELQPQVFVEPAIAFVALHQELDGRERLAVAQQIARQLEVSAPMPPSPPRRSAGTLRLGILSPDFREHLNCYLLLPLFELLDRRKFELHAYSLSSDDGSAIRAKVAASCAHFRDMHTMSDRELAEEIRKDDIDILVDVAGHTTGGRVAITMQRPARIQALYLGFPSSLGSTRVDFAITDCIVGCDPAEWTEALVHLRHTYYLYDFRETVPALPISRTEYGLPEDAFVYCAFHKAEKISHDVFDLWMEIVARVPRSVLWLLALPEAAQRNLRREALNRGIDPARLKFSPFDARDRYLARQRLGDLMLDALHHNAMTTACDAMAAGLPVLTLPGNAMASRAGESLARAAGVPEMVARDKDDYVKKAVYLASKAQDLQRIRQKLLSRTGPLFDTIGRVRELEQAFLEMWQRYEQRL